MIFNPADHTKTHYLQNSEEPAINYEIKSFLKYTLKRQAAELYFETFNSNIKFLEYDSSKHFQETFVPHSAWYLLEITTIRKIFRKTTISYPMIRTSTWAY